VAVFPSETMPAASIDSVTLSEMSGTWSAYAADPKVVRTPAVRLRSLIAVGTPNSGDSPTGPTASDRARVSACSAVTVTNAPRGVWPASSRSMRSR